MGTVYCAELQSTSASALRHVMWLV